jgi:subtilisin-like proprotein convertase family protein
VRNFPFLKSFASSLVLCAAMTASNAAEHYEPLYYWNGDQRVELVLAVDEIATDQVAPDNGGEQAEGKVGKRTSILGKSGKSIVAVAAKNKGELLAAHKNKPQQNSRWYAVVYPSHEHNDAASAQLVTDQLVVCFVSEEQKEAAIKQHKLEIVETLRYRPWNYVCRVTAGGLLDAVTIANHLCEHEKVVYASPLISRTLRRKGDPNDGLFAQQWHLKNTGQLGGGAGNDINVTPVWNFTNNTGLGTGVNIAIVDDGLETTHEDLSANARTDIDIDINFNDPDPTPTPSNTSDVHGTFVAGLAAGRGNNNLGATGAAPSAGLVGVRLIAAATTAAQEAQAMSHGVSENNPQNRVHVSNNSWGPSDDGQTLEAPSVAMLDALADGVTNGRGGLGVIYVWAGGNGFTSGDVSNYDGYASTRFVIAVAATDYLGRYADYSEFGTNIFVNAPGGSGPNKGMVGADRTGAPGFSNSAGNYTAATDVAQGTSFSAPVVAGVIALMLEANPQLTWRDVRHIIARTSTKNDSTQLSWITNAAGRQFNRNYGFGRINAEAAVNAAKTWVTVPPLATVLTASRNQSALVPDNNPAGVTQTVTINSASNYRTEYVELTVNANHPFRGELQFLLTAPSGTVSDFFYREVDLQSNFSNWTFTSVVHWDEVPNGIWTLKVVDKTQDDVGSLVSWGLKIHGYNDNPAPTITATSPVVIPVGSGNTNVVIDGTNFSNGITRVTVNNVTVTPTINSATQLTITVPSTQLTTHQGLTISIANDQFAGGASTAASRIIQVGASPQISKPTNQTINEGTSTAALAVTLSDADNDALTLTATSSNTSIIPASGVTLGGSGNNRTIMLTPASEVNGGPVTITLSVNDGFMTVTDSFTVTVTPVNDPPVAVDGRYFSKTTDSSFEIPLASLAYDPDLPGTALTNFSMSVGGGISLSSGIYKFTPSFFTTPGVKQFIYSVTSQGQTTNGNLYFTIMGDPNGVRPLIVSEPNDEIIAAGETFTYHIRVDTRRYTVAPSLNADIISPPLGATLNLTNTTGTIQTWTVQFPTTGGDANRHVVFGVVFHDSFALKGTDVQWIVVRVVGTSVPN